MSRPMLEKLEANPHYTLSPIQRRWLNEYRSTDEVNLVTQEVEPYDQNIKVTRVKRRKSN